MQNVQNERVVSTSGDERNIIFRDGNEWKWYYSDEADEYNNVIKLRTHTYFVGPPPLKPPKNLEIK